MFQEERDEMDAQEKIVNIFRDILDIATNTVHGAAQDPNGPKAVNQNRLTGNFNRFMPPSQTAGSESPSKRK